MCSLWHARAQGSRERHLIQKEICGEISKKLRPVQQFCCDHDAAAHAIPFTVRIVLNCEQYLFQTYDKRYTNAKSKNNRAGEARPREERSLVQSSFYFGLSNLSVLRQYLSSYL